MDATMDLEALHHSADFLARQADRLRQELAAFNPPALRHAELPQTEIDRLLQESKWLADRTMRLWTQVRHHRRLRDAAAPMHDFQVPPAHPRYEIAADARSAAELLSLLASRAGQMHLPTPDGLPQAVTALHQWADTATQEPPS